MSIGSDHPTCTRIDDGLPPDSTWMLCCPSVDGVNVLLSTSIESSPETPSTDQLNVASGMMFPSRSVAIGFNCNISPVSRFESCPSMDTNEILPTLTSNTNSSDMFTFPLSGPLYSARTVQFPTSVPSNVA